VDVATDRLGAYRSFVSAATGDVIGRLDRAYTQQATIALGQGQWYTMKMPVLYDSGTYFLADVFRPGVTPIRGLSGIAVLTLNDRNECCPGDRCLSLESIGRSPSDRWPDPVEADAHARAGWVDDFYFRMFRRAGWAGDWLMAVQVVHFCDYRVDIGTALNASFTEAFFPHFGLMLYGDGIPGMSYPFTSGFDVIVHEFTHGTTATTSGLVYFRESGALNEAFSDIMAVTAEFAFEPEGNGYGQADWLIGEDLFRTSWFFCDNPGARALRSFIDPLGGGCSPQPSHYALLYTGPADNGGVHINSGIINHAFYLLAVGGRHRLSGIAVPAIGLERAAGAFYVGFTQCLWPTAVFRDARYCVAEAARNLYGADAASAVHTAFDAVGVPR
jgi:Zn-dependent metalloprotease